MANSAKLFLPENVSFTTADTHTTIMPSPVRLLAAFIYMIRRERIITRGQSHGRCY